MSSSPQVIEPIQIDTFGDILKNIWTKPRAVFAAIEAQQFHHYSTIFFVFAGVSRFFDSARLQHLGDHISLWRIVVSCCLGGVLFGWIFYYIYAFLVHQTGKWLDGKASTKSIMRVLAYALIPSAIGTLLLIPQIEIFGADFFKEEAILVSSNATLNVVFYLAVLLEAIFAIWSVSLFVIGIAVLQQISIWKALLNAVLPIFVLAVFFFSIFFLMR